MVLRNAAMIANPARFYLPGILLPGILAILPGRKYAVLS